METEGAGEEGAGADETAGEEAAGAAAAEAGEGSGDRTDDPEAAGAPGAAPTVKPSAASAEPGSEEPQPGSLLAGGLISTGTFLAGALCLHWLNRRWV